MKQIIAWATLQQFQKDEAMIDARDIVERPRATTYTRERWVEPVGNVDEPCDADDLGAVECLRNRLPSVRNR